MAKVLRFSQPTVTRTRRKLEDEKYILQYTAVPDFTKLGFELAAFTFAQWTAQEAGTELPYKGLEKDPRVIFIAEGSGIDGKNAIIITVHKNYTDYSDFIAALREKTKIQTMNSFLTALTSIKKHLNLAGLEKA